MRELNGKRVLVTGGAGFIGSHLVTRALERGASSVAAVDNLFLGREENLADARKISADVRFHNADCTDFDAMRRIFEREKPDAVFHMAVIPLLASLERPRWTVDENVRMTTVVCELLRRGACGALVHFSSSEAYGSAQYVPMDENHPLLPTTPYAAAKPAADLVALSYHSTFGLDISVVRPFNTFGPRQSDGPYCGIIPAMIRRMVRGEPLVVQGDGEQTRDFMYVQDTADGALSVFEHEAARGSVINIASGREISILALTHMLRELMRSTVPVIHEPARPADVRRHCASIERAKELLAFEPSISLREGLTATIAWYRGHYCAEAS